MAETVESFQEQIPENNETPIESKVNEFPVIEIFGPTIQGEGQMVGMQTMFIRFGGCDYRCTKCDSLHAVLPALVKRNAVWMTVEDIMTQLTKLAGFCTTVTISGGNPCIWDIKELTMALITNQWTIGVETQGTLRQQWLSDCDYITVCPKGPGMGEEFEPDKFGAFMESVGFNIPGRKGVTTKFVIFDQRDIEFAKDVIQFFGLDPEEVYLSLGNPWPPAPAEQAPHDETPWKEALLDRYKTLLTDIQKEPLLSKTRYLPQLHVLLWGNEQGR